MTSDNLGVVAVQVPQSAINHSHGVWLNTYVLDGLRYIMARADDLNVSRVVVNISLAGGMGGRLAQGFLPAAIDRFIHESEGRLVVVMSAGNQRLSGLHVSLSVPADGRSAPARFRVPADLRESLMIEWRQRLSNAQLRLVLVRSDDLNSETIVGPDERKAWLSGGLPIPDGDLALATNAEGQQGLIALHLRSVGGLSALAGEWQVSFDNLSSTTVACDLWIARNDAPDDPGDEGLQVGFRSPPADPDDTLSTVARCQHAMLVGGYLAPGPSWPADMMDESGAGRYHGRGPDLCGVAVAPRMAFCTDEADDFEEAESTGTSIATAFVTRRILLHCAGLWTKEDIKVRLKERCGNQLRDPSGGAQGHWRSDLWVGP